MIKITCRPADIFASTLLNFWSLSSHFSLLSSFFFWNIFFGGGTNTESPRQLCPGQNKIKIERKKRSAPLPSKFRNHQNWGVRYHFSSLSPSPFNAKLICSITLCIDQMETSTFPPGVYPGHLTNWCAPGGRNLTPVIDIGVGIWHHLGGVGRI